MTMHYLANVPSIETSVGVMFYSPYNPVEVVYPRPDDPAYWVFSFHGIEPKRAIERFDQAMDYAARAMMQADPA